VASLGDKILKYQSDRFMHYVELTCFSMSSGRQNERKWQKSFVMIMIIMDMNVSRPVVQLFDDCMPSTVVVKS
jgi:hypothetical protein